MVERSTSNAEAMGKDVNLVLGVSSAPGHETVTARKAGGIRDMKLPVSPKAVPIATALQNLAKAINLALEGDFIETDLDKVYKAARVHDGTVQIQHVDYIGLGDGAFAQIGRLSTSFRLTVQGPDAASPEGKKWLEAHGRGTLSGLTNFIGRKLNFIQEFEDKVPTFVQQMLDRLEAANMIVGWDRGDWHISTTDIGLEVMIKPAGKSAAA